MIRHVTRLMTIIVCLSLSTIVIHYTKAPSHLRMDGFKVACLINKSTNESDRNLSEYAHVVHNSVEDKDSPIKSYHCYFRFPTTDVACMPKNVAKRQPKLQHCPCYITSSQKACYFLKKKYNPLLAMLKQKPRISHTQYNGVIKKTWQEVRDYLIGTPTHSQRIYKNKTSLKKF